MTETSDRINDDEQQLIKLCLKKPKKWNWELTTSKSSSNIFFPTIQLFDEDNETLLAETNEANYIAGSKLCKSASISKTPSSAALLFNSAQLTNDPITRETPLTSPVVIKRDFFFEKQRSRSSCSVRSRSSILTRIREFSELKEQDDSTDNDDDDVDNEKKSCCNKSSILRDDESLRKKYSMRTCNIGTILVPKESFSHVSRRRRRKSDANSSLNGE
jgi:hypothetical protein